MMCLRESGVQIDEPLEVKERGKCVKIRKSSRGCVEQYTLCAYGSGVQDLNKCDDCEQE